MSPIHRSPIDYFTNCLTPSASDTIPIAPKKATSIEPNAISFSLINITRLKWARLRSELFLHTRCKTKTLRFPPKTGAFNALPFLYRYVLHIQLVNLRVYFIVQSVLKQRTALRNPRAVLQMPQSGADSNCVALSLICTILWQDAEEGERRMKLAIDDFTLQVNYEPL